MRIKSLSSAVANQIAAGEVIENPASVVKELLENALDASATTITIDIGFGGLNQIKISDNGAGIIADDLPLAIAPHATSKLTQLADLSTLTSMGFRGEALASIASISRLTISSKPADQDHAMMLQLDGTTVQLSPCARNQGTTIDVRDLFYNAPVRRRFLKSERSEYLAIEQVVKRFALSAPHIALVLKHNGKHVLELPAATGDQSLQIRIKKLLGKSFVDHAIAIDVERAGMRITGWISSYAYQRSQNDKQWIYLNQRMVKDKLIHHALKQAYDNRLYPGRYPSCLLYLSIPTDCVDVNVHPTKHEVRFQQPRLVHDFIGSQIALALMDATPQETAGCVTHDVEVDHPGLLQASAQSRQALSEVGVTLPEMEGLMRCAPPLEDLPPTVLREDYIACPQFAVIPTDTKRPTPWIILNQQFGLITWNQHPYLFNIPLALQAHCLSILTQHSEPLASRPLLVPISIEHNTPDESRLKRSLNACEPFGIRMEMTDTRVILRTLPMSMPQLNIKAVLSHVIDRMPEVNEIPELLAACQPTEPSQLSAGEKDAIGDYILQQLEQKTTVPAWCLRLDEDRCQELMRA